MRTLRNLPQQRQAHPENPVPVENLTPSVYCYLVQTESEWFYQTIKMNTQKTFPSAPDNDDNPPTYNDAIGLDETRIPMVKTDASRGEIARETVTVNQADEAGGTECAVTTLLCSLALVFPILGLALTLWAHLAPPGGIRGREVAKGFGYVCLIGSYLCIYLPVFLRCHKINKILAEMVPEAELLRYVDSIRQARPKIIWKMNCFHEDDRTVTITAPSGITRTERHHEKVNTWSGEQEFVFNRWENDTTPDVPRLDSGGYHIVTSSVEYALNDCPTREAYAQQKGTFVNANKHQDREHTVEEIVEVGGMELHKKMVVQTSGDWFLSLPVYQIATVLLLAYPYIWIAKSMERKTAIRFVKKISV